MLMGTEFAIESFSDFATVFDLHILMFLAEKSLWVVWKWFELIKNVLFSLHFLRTRAELLESIHWIIIWIIPSRAEGMGASRRHWSFILGIYLWLTWTSNVWSCWHSWVIIFWWYVFWCCWSLEWHLQWRAKVHESCVRLSRRIASSHWRAIQGIFIFFIYDIWYRAL